MVEPKRSGGRLTPKGTKPGSSARAGGGSHAARRPEPVRKAVKRSKGPTQKSAEGGAIQEASARYTPKQSYVVMRPGWHRIAGWIGVALGLLIVILNDVMRFGNDLRLLPFGHSELYLMFGMVIAGGSTWFLGLFDRQTVYR